MEKTNGKRTALTILVVLTLAFIWGNSLMPGAISGAISDWFGAVLSHIFGGQVYTAMGCFESWHMERNIWCWG